MEVEEEGVGERKRKRRSRRRNGDSIMQRERCLRLCLCAELKGRGLKLKKLEECGSNGIIHDQGKNVSEMGKLGSEQVLQIGIRFLFLCQR